MMTCGVQNMRYGRGNGGRLFECRGETVGNVNMEPIAAKTVAITVAANQETCLSRIPTPLHYAKWPTTFVGRGPYGKSRLSKLRENP